MPCVLAVDHGTSGMKVSVVDGRGRVLGSGFCATEVVHLPDGGVEQDPDLWWEALGRASRQAVAQSAVAADAVTAVCVSSTFSTTVAVGHHGGHLHNAITWLDGRGAPYVKEVVGGFPSLMGYGLRQVARWLPKTGGAPTLSGKDDAAHALLIKHRYPGIYAKTKYFLPSKDYLNLRLCGEAASTFDAIQLFWVTDIRDLSSVRYDPGLIRALGLDAAKLPPLVSSTQVLGKVRPTAADHLGIGGDAVVVAGSPDHQAACLGSGAVDDFCAHLYIGTSSWVQCLVPFKKTDVFHSIACFPSSLPNRYQTVNEQDMAGGCLAFAADMLLGEPPSTDTFRRMDAMAARAEPGSGGALFLPWLNGERTPVDDPNLRGGWVNLSHTTTRDQMVRAVLEGVAHNTRWSLGYVETFVGRRLDPITAVGGGAESDLWCQILADVLDRTIRRTEAPKQANARGAAFLALAALNRVPFSALPGLVKVDKTFVPAPDTANKYRVNHKKFLRYYRSVRRWYGDRGALS